MDDILPLPSSIVPPSGGKQWVVLEDPKDVQLYLREWPPLPGDQIRSRVICWADLTSQAGKIDHLIVYFHASTHHGFRTAERLEHDLRGLGKLQSLSIPISFIPTLDPDMLPPSLRRIEVDGDGRASFPKGRVFPGVQVLNAWSPLSAPNAEVKFERGAFPDLQEVTCRLDAKGVLFDNLATYPRLASLWTGPIKDASILSKLGAAAIDFVTLERGTAASLEGVQNIRGMRCLKLKNMDRLTDISALESCEHLEILEIHYCANLRDHEPILRIPGLKSVVLFRCNALDPKACAEDFASRPSLRTRMSACDGSRRAMKG